MMQSLVSAPLRGELVRAAEAVLDKQAGLPRNPENSQLSRLVQVASEAACAEEIANYLRYQGARGRWRRSLAEDVIAAIAPLLGSLGSDPERVAAWRLYATYLRRSYYYRREVNRDRERSRRRETSAPRGEPLAHDTADGAAERPRERRRARRRRRAGAPAQATPPSTEPAHSAEEFPGAAESPLDAEKGQHAAVEGAIGGARAAAGDGPPQRAPKTPAAESQPDEGERT
jgi:hypothetical protein